VKVRTFIICILCLFILLLSVLLYIEFKDKPSLSSVNPNLETSEQGHGNHINKDEFNNINARINAQNKATSAQKQLAKELSNEHINNNSTTSSNSPSSQTSTSTPSIVRNNANSNFDRNTNKIIQSKSNSHPYSDDSIQISSGNEINNIYPKSDQPSNTKEASLELSENDLDKDKSEDAKQLSDEPLQSEPQIIIAGDIAGKVVDDEGVTLANVIVVATPFDVAEGQDSTARQRLTTQTNSEGSYVFANVATASYKICNIATNNISRSCIQLLPPQKTADLKVRSLNRPITVFGQITDESGSPIEGVNVRLSAQKSVTSTTRSDGQYSIETTISKDENPTIYFQHTDYSRSKARIMTNQAAQENGYQMNAQLNRIEGFTVIGRVIDDEGQPVAGQNIGLRDINNRNGSRRFARSDNNGKVRIQHITAGEGYSPIVLPSAEFTYKAPEPKIAINVFDDSASFEVVVTRKQLTYSELRLYINNQAQQPVTGVTFNLTSAGKSLGNAKTDENGELLFNKVPDSNLTLNSSVLPLNVSRINRDRNNGATITADTGENDIIINITGKDNAPIFCKSASIRWFRLQNEMRIQSRKNLVVDQNGRTEGSKFGAGEHELDLKRCTSTTTGRAHRNKSQKINIGSQVEFNIELDPL